MGLIPLRTRKIVEGLQSFNLQIFYFILKNSSRTVNTFLYSVSSEQASAKALPGDANTARGCSRLALGTPP